MTNTQRYNKIFQEILNISAEQDLQGLELKKTPHWDSISHLSLVTAMEDEFDIMLDAEEILDFDSYIRGKMILNKYGVGLD